MKGESIMATIITNTNKSYNVSVNYNVATYKPNFTKMANLASSPR